MWVGLSLFYVGAVLCLNGLWMLGRIEDREIWIINIFNNIIGDFFIPSSDFAFCYSEAW